MKHPLSAPYLWEKTVTLNAVGSVTASGSTHLSGYIEHIYVKISKAAGAGSLVKITSSSTAHLLFVLPDPSTIGLYYRVRPVEHNTTGAELLTYTGRHSLCNEKARISVASSSGLAGATVHVQFIISK